MNKADTAARSWTAALNRNAAVAGIQAFWWIWARPSAWQEFLAARNPSLAPDFTLGDVVQPASSDRETRRLFLGLLFCWSLFCIGSSALTAIAVGLPRGQVFFAVLYGLILSAAGTFLTSSLLSTAAGFSGGLVIGSVFALAASTALRSAGSVSAIAAGLQHASLVRIIAGGIPAIVPLNAGTGAAICIGIGITGGLTGVPATIGRMRPAPRQAAGVTVGVLLATMGDILFLAVLTYAQPLVSVLALRFIACLLLALLILAAASLGPHSGRRSGRLAAGLAIAALASIGIGFGGESNAGIAVVFFGATTALLYSSIFSIAFSAAVQVADPWAGAIASALGSGIPFVLFLSLVCHAMPAWPAIPLSILCICAGLLIPRFLYVTVYPFEMAWNAILYRMDRKRIAGTVLRRNAAFWDERQKLPLYGLDDHLLLALERDRALGSRAMVQLATGPNSWAVGAVRMELCARALEGCSSLESIGEAHRAIAGIQGANPEEPVKTFHGISRAVHAALQFENAIHRHTLLKTIEVQLGSLMLQAPSESGGARLVQVLRQWSLLVADAVSAFSDAVRERAEIENPYVIGVPLNAEQAVFIGRSEISLEIAQSILGPHSPPLLLYGQRRMGKTSLLNNFVRILPAEILPLFVDLQGPASIAGSAPDFLAGVSAAMADSAFQTRGIRLPALGRERLKDGALGEFDRWLDSLEHAVSERVILLALDEFETLTESVARRSLDAQAFLGLLRHTIQHRRRFRVLVAASHSADEFGSASSYLINLRMVKLGFLNESEIIHLVQSPLRGFPLVYSGEAMRRVIDLTRGHPHLLQLLCYEIVCVKNAQDMDRRRSAVVEDVEEAAQRALQSGRFFFLDIAHNQLSAEARGLAIGIARGFDCAESDSGAVSQLLRREIVEQEGSRLRFQVELVRRWFAQPNLEDRFNNSSI